MANVIIKKSGPRTNDAGWRKEAGLAKQMLEKPGHYRRSQRDDAKKLLGEFGIKKKEKWTVFDD